MMDVDISHIWSGISLPELLAIEKDISDAHEKLSEAWTGWMGAQELPPILEAAQTIRRHAPICVVVASEDVCAGIRAIMELLPAEKDAPEMIFAGFTLSPRQWNTVVHRLEGKDFSAIVISRTGTTLESAIAFRDLRWMMERRFGTEEAARRIYTVTEEGSPLWQMAQEHRWRSLPMGTEAQFDVLGPAGLLPMAVAGLDVEKILRGAEKTPEQYNLRSFENPLWLYTGVRNALYHKGYDMEVFSGFGMGFRQLGAWWQQLFAGTEGKQGKGPMPVPAEYPQDFYTLGCRLQAGQRRVFETMVSFETQWTDHTIGSDVSNLDGLNHLAGQTLEQVRRQSHGETVFAHDEVGIPVMTMDAGILDAQKLGEMFGFLILSCCLSAYVLGIDLFPRPEAVTEADGKQEIQK